MTERLETFKILKCNRVWASCLMKPSGTPFKLRVDEQVRSLEIGETLQMVLVDVSIVSKYGTDLKFELASESTQDAGIVTLTPLVFNQDLKEAAHKLGGKWDAQSWVFSAVVADKVEELEERFCTDIVMVQLTYISEGYSWDSQPLRILGYSIASATGRDSGAKLFSDIAVVAGDIISAGSRKNWYVKALEGTTLRMQMPRALLADLDPEEISYEILDI